MSDEKQKHTPGPWFVERGSEESWNPAVLAGADVIGAPGYDSCVASVVGRVTDVQANARLMAASPDLLDVARMAEQVADLSLLADDEWNAECTTIIDRFRAAARAALAKAGVTP